MESIDSHEGPNAMQQAAQCADSEEGTDTECTCPDPGNCSKETAGADEGESMSALRKDQEAFPRTVTGVIRIMQASGRKDAAEFWEELHETERQAARLLDSLQRLHRKKTGCFPQIEKRQQHADEE